MASLRRHDGLLYLVVEGEERQLQRAERREAFLESIVEREGAEVEEGCPNEEAQPRAGELEDLSVRKTFPQGPDASKHSHPKPSPLFAPSPTTTDKGPTPGYQNAKKRMLDTTGKEDVSDAVGRKRIKLDGTADSLLQAGPSMPHTSTTSVGRGDTPQSQIAEAPGKIAEAPGKVAVGPGSERVENADGKRLDKGSLTGGRAAAGCGVQETVAPDTDRRSPVAAETTLGPVPDKEDGDQHMAEEEEGPDEGAEDSGLEIEGDTQCALCDNGGDLLMCDGPCLRGFHVPEEEDNEDCNPLGVPTDLAKAIMEGHSSFECPNCATGIQQCYSCKEEGPSQGPHQDLYRCSHINCGKFYCMRCREMMLHSKGLKGLKGSRNGTRVPGSAGQTVAISGKAGAGSPKGMCEPDAKGGLFLCPLHKCKVCGEGEVTKKNPLVGCRRCPKAYHKDCMPPTLRNDEQRVWLAKYNEDGTVADETEVSRDLFYCKRHALAEDVMATGAVHDKPLFSDAVMNKWRKMYAHQYSYLESSIEYLESLERARRAPKQRADRKYLKPKSRLKTHQRSSPQAIARSSKVVAAAPRVKIGTMETRPAADAEDIDSRYDMFGNYTTGHEVRRRLCEAQRALSERNVEAVVWKFPPYDDDARVPKLTPDKVEGWLKSVKMAQEHPHSARDIIPDKTALSISKAKDVLQSYLGPLLFSRRYTSYGRHFTIPEVLDEVVRQLLKHIAVDDQVVDFSCGSNAFIALLKTLCEGKEIDFKAYDPFTPKVTTAWQRESWFNVRPRQLNPGDHLVIGLNPPFGKNGSLASQFVMHAAKFQPRVIALIVPPKTPVPTGYDVVYEDKELCADKSFYIPGVKQASWNVVAPAFRILERTSPPIPNELQYLQPQDFSFVKATSLEAPESPMQGNTDFQEEESVDGDQLEQSLPTALAPVVECAPYGVLPDASDGIPKQSIVNWPGVGGAPVDGLGLWTGASMDTHGVAPLDLGDIDGQPSRGHNDFNTSQAHQILSEQDPYEIDEVQNGVHSVSDNQFPTGPNVSDPLGCSAPPRFGLSPSSDMVEAAHNGDSGLDNVAAPSFYEVATSYPNQADDLQTPHPSLQYGPMYRSNDYGERAHDGRRGIATDDVLGIGEESYSIDGDFVVAPERNSDYLRTWGNWRESSFANNGHEGHIGERWKGDYESNARERSQGRGQNVHHRRRQRGARRGYGRSSGRNQ
ncbi:unnamed protein product [Ostreobium quekettii]|uniref:Zinc finger PHD-type domain-containing protein n=1 Tax=Ostreobium quekettii TaxID=121088 RepID=A0A8S1JAW1_9CHLO|nr:unnamed protein product [Ostreobium quekettii]